MKRSKNDNDFGKRGLKVEVRNGDINGALRRFKKVVQEDGVLQEVRNRQHFEKPSIVKAKAKAAARARHLKAISKRKKDLGY